MGVRVRGEGEGVPHPTNYCPRTYYFLTAYPLEAIALRFDPDRRLRLRLRVQRVARDGTELVGGAAAGDGRLDAGQGRRREETVDDLVKS